MTLQIEQCLDPIRALARIRVHFGRIIASHRLNCDASWSAVGGQCLIRMDGRLIEIFLLVNSSGITISAASDLKPHLNAEVLPWLKDQVFRALKDPA